MILGDSIDKVRCVSLLVIVVKDFNDMYIYVRIYINYIFVIIVCCNGVCYVGIVIVIIVILVIYSIIVCLICNVIVCFR